jgi:hypothetical protein
LGTSESCVSRRIPLPNALAPVAATIAARTAQSWARPACSPAAQVEESCHRPGCSASSRALRREADAAMLVE